MRQKKQALSVLDRREMVSRMLSLEYSQDEIAQKLGIRKATVCKDAYWIREFARKKILLNRKEVMDLAFNRLEMVSREAVLGWRRSQEDAVEVTTETVPDEESGGEVVVKRIEKRKGQVGSPAFLDTVKDATWKTATLFGAVVKDGGAPVVGSGPSDELPPTVIEYIVASKAGAQRVRENHHVVVPEAMLNGSDAVKQNSADLRVGSVESGASQNDRE